MPERISNLVNRLGRTIHCLQFAEGLNPAQWEALRFIGRANRYSRTPSALADYLRTTKGTASQTIKCLESKGLIERAPNTIDRRGVLLNITEEGRSILCRDPLKCLESAAGCLGTEVEAANRILTGLIGRLEESSAQRAFGVCEDCTHFCKNAAAADVALGDLTVENGKSCGKGSTNAGDHKCGLTGENLSTAESSQICVNYRR